MSAYVDNARIPFRGRMKMCHLLADSLEELHAMAAAAGLKREWFQTRPVPHYDLCLTNRAKAVAAGAQEIDRRQVVAVMRAWRQKCQKCGKPTRSVLCADCGRSRSAAFDYDPNR